MLSEESFAPLLAIIERYKQFSVQFRVVSDAHNAVYIPVREHPKKKPPIFKHHPLKKHHINAS